MSKNNKQIKSVDNKVDNRKLFVVRKYVWADTAQDALKIEKKQEAHECWIDDDWKKNKQEPKDCIGFVVDKLEEY